MGVRHSSVYWNLNKELNKELNKDNNDMITKQITQIANKYYLEDTSIFGKPFGKPDKTYDNYLHFGITGTKLMYYPILYGDPDTLLTKFISEVSEYFKNMNINGVGVQNSFLPP